MRIYGYDANKRVVATEFSLYTVVKKGIHPWRIDLFDRRPIKLRVAGQELFFSRLNDISFAYLDKQPHRYTLNNSRDAWNTGYFGTVSSGARTCCEGTITNGNVAKSGNKSGTHPALIEVSSVQFNSAWWRYLQLAPDDQSLVEQAYPIGDGKNIILRQGKVEYTLPKSSSSNVYRFEGEMFAEIRLRQTLPQAINLVFNLFENLRPVVYGGALRDVLCGGAPPRDINFMADVPSPARIKERLGEIMANSAFHFENTVGRSKNHVFEFRLGGISYQMISRRSVLADRFWEVNDFSPMQAIASQPNEIIASRICLWDIAHKQARPTATHSPSDEELRSREFSYKYEREQTLRKRGYKLLPDAF